MLRLLVLAFVVLELAGCASSIFVPYPLRAAQYQQGLRTGSLPPAIKETEKQLHSRDALLALLERGRLAQISGDYAQSQQAFQAASNKLQEIDDRAAISLSYSAAQGTALVSNDNAIPYQSASYERIFLNLFQAFNYLAQHDQEGAAVEMRRAQFLQDQTRDSHNESVNTSDQLSPEALQHYQQELGNINDLAARVTSSTQNAYSFYVAGVLYEASGKLDDAYIDYKRALSIAPNNRFVQGDALRLAQQLHRTDDLTALKDAKASATAKKDEGTVIVLYEEGFTPAKEELFLPFPWPQAWYVLAIPYYKSTWQVATPLAITSADLNKTISTQPVVDVQALAARALKDNLISILLRQTLRAQSKHKLQEQTRAQGGDLLGLLVGAYNVFSENADLRSWLTLPRYAHVARFNLSEGTHQLTLNGSQSVPIQMTRQGFVLLRVVHIDNQYYVAQWPL